MEYIKIFRSYISNNQNTKEFEDKINSWMEENKDIQIIDRQTKNDEHTIFIILFYKHTVSL